MSNWAHDSSAQAGRAINDSAHADSGTVNGPYADPMTSTAPLSLGLADAVLAMSSTLAAINFYLDESDLEGDFLSTAAERRERLYEHLRAVEAGHLVLVGEATGWQGARQSGVPFTSSATVGLRGNKEPSATAVHRLLASAGVGERALLWNAFLLHPHDPGKPRTSATQPSATWARIWPVAGFSTGNVAPPSASTHSSLRKSRVCSVPIVAEWVAVGVIRVLCRSVSRRARFGGWRGRRRGCRGLR